MTDSAIDNATGNAADNTNPNDRVSVPDSVSTASSTSSNSTSGNIDNNGIGYAPDPAVERLNPLQPELWTDALPPQTVPSSDAPLPPVSTARYQVDNIVDTMAGGGAPSSETGDITLRGFGDSLAMPDFQRQPARAVFTPNTTDTADPVLLERFVTNNRLTEIWTQLDQLQEDVIRNVRADRASTDAYQQDLLYASTLLLQAPANYDDARQIILRVRADLLREKRVAEDTRKYMPRLLAYYAAWFVVTLIATNLDPQFRQIMPDGLPILKLAYPALLFGIFGALFNGTLALLQHANIRRDFDSTHSSWFLINPLIGGFLGIIVFIFFVVTGSSFTPDLATRSDLSTLQAPLAIWLLAFIVGWQQNIVFRILNRFLNTVLPPDRETAVSTRPEGITMPSTTFTTTTTTTPNSATKPQQSQSSSSSSSTPLG